MSGQPGLPSLPPAAPRSRTAPWRWCAWVLRRIGWRLVGEFPDERKLVLIVAPHTSWWDGVIGLLFQRALGIDVAFIAKRELFVGPLGALLRRFGGIPIEREAAGPVVRQTVANFDAGERLWLAITPEGTRKAVVRWKSGFWRIARASAVPILPVYFDYPSRTVGLGPLFHPGADLDADLETLRAFYAPYRGKHRGVG